jgi:hypothetical protein
MAARNGQVRTPETPASSTNNLKRHRRRQHRRHDQQRRAVPSEPLEGPVDVPFVEAAAHQCLATLAADRVERVSTPATEPSVVIAAK